MKNIKSFAPQFETPQKMTNTRLLKAIDELGINYTYEKENGAIRITLNLPEEHIKEKAELMKDAVLNDSYHTKFDKEKILPLLRKIKRSANLDCTIKDTLNQRIIMVTKK